MASAGSSAAEDKFANVSLHTSGTSSGHIGKSIGLAEQSAVAFGQLSRPPGFEAQALHVTAQTTRATDSSSADSPVRDNRSNNHPDVRDMLGDLLTSDVYGSADVPTDEDDIAGEDRSSLAAYVLKSVTSALRSSRLARVLTIVSKAGSLPADTLVSACKRFGIVTGFSHKQADGGATGSVSVINVHFDDSRVCGIAAGKLSSLPGVVECTVSRDVDTALTGFVLALKRTSEHSGSSMPMHVQAMVSAFGDIASATVVVLPGGADAGLIAQVFEYYSCLASQHAVESVGNRPGATISLHLVGSDGTILDAPVPSSDGPGLDGMTARDVEPLPGAVSNPAMQPAAAPPAHLGVQQARPFYDQRVFDFANPPAAGPYVKPRHDNLTFNTAEAASGDPCARATVMIRNIPCRWTAEDLLGVLCPIIGETWDMLYMPCKHADLTNSGYAFINFISSVDALRLYNAMHGRFWPHTQSGKTCAINYARIQGRQLLNQFAKRKESSFQAFRGYLAFPIGGKVIIQGPEHTRPPAPPTAPRDLGSAAPSYGMRPPNYQVLNGHMLNAGPPDPAASGPPMANPQWMMAQGNVPPQYGSMYGQGRPNAAGPSANAISTQVPGGYQSGNSSFDMRSLWQALAHDQDGSYC